MHRRLILLIALLIFVALQGPMRWSQETGSTDEMIFGPDSFMRLQRVIDLNQTGNWYDTFQQHTNAPYGETLHWTRPMDALLFAGAWAGSFFTDFNSALLLWGIVVSPLLLAVTILVWSWGTRPVLDDTAYLLSVAIIILLPQFDAAYKLGRPDHHSLLMLLFVGQLAVFYRLTQGLARPRHVAAGGVLTGIALWVSLESLSHLLFFGAVLGVLWIWRGGEFLRQIAVYLGAMAATLAVSLAIERAPHDWMTAQYDRLSIVQLTLVAVGAITWAAIHQRSHVMNFASTVRGRLGAAAIGVAVPGIVIGAAFPIFFYGPFAEIGSEEFHAWVDVIAEYHAIVPVDRFTTGMFAAHLGPALIAAGYIWWRWKRAEPAEKNLLVFWSIGLAMFVPVALDAIRWAMYVQVIVWLPWVLTIVTLARTPWLITIRQRRVPVHAFLAPVLVLAPISLGMIILPPKTAEAAKGKCDWTAMGKYLEAHRTAAPGEEIVFSHFFQGSQLIWRTGYRAVGAPYGNDRSLHDTNAVFKATVMEDAHDIITRRGIDWVMTCPSGGEARLYKNKDKKTFYMRLDDREPPPWLRDSKLPDNLTATFRLYRVVPTGG